MIASKLDWSQIENFKKSEFPAGILRQTSGELIEQLAKYRTHLGKALYPSPDPEGWVRMTGSEESQHYAVGRRSTAGDVFLSSSQDARYAFTLACQYFNGVGIYYDTKLNGQPRIMLHLDLRDTPTVWCRHHGEYLYPAKGGRDADAFYHLLNIGLPQP